MSTISNNNGEAPTLVSSNNVDQLNEERNETIVISECEVKNNIITESVSSVQSDKLPEKQHILNKLIRNVQTQHGNALTVDEENIVIISRCPSPDRIPYEFDGVFIEPFHDIDEDKVSFSFGFSL